MSTASTFEQEMLALINEERTSRGLDPLQLETRLNESSEDHSTWMLNTDTFRHTGAGGSSATDRMEDAGFDFEGNWRSGENIAWQSERGAPGISDDVEQLHQALMNSPGHRANILNPDYEYIGIGIEEGNFNGWDAVMVTQNFATTDADVVPDTGFTPPPPVEEVVVPDEPVAEEPETDVVEAPAVETPAPTAPAAAAPETVVIETEEPDTSAPEVTNSEEPEAETPELNVIETEVTETDEAEIVDLPGDDAFDVEDFLAAIDDFVADLIGQVDDIDLNTSPTTGNGPAEDDFILTWNWGGFGGRKDAAFASEDTGTDTYDDVFNPFSFFDGCAMDFV